METIQAIGMMSGTSLDGLDMAACQFTNNDGKWAYQILKAETISYPPKIEAQLRKVTELSGLDLHLLDVQLGEYMGKSVAEFIDKNQLKPTLVASHGHTVFHQPENRLTLQIGNGFSIYNAVRVPVVNDFRSLDLQFGGQGAPLVPIGDELLFGDYGACLNLGGIANVSFDAGGKRIAFDITAVNMVLNHLAERLGFSYDEKGAIAKSGKLVPDLLEKLEKLPYYQVAPPKSTGFEMVYTDIIPLLEPTYRTEDLLHTYTIHAAAKVATAVNEFLPAGSKILMTGGGAYNDFLITQIKQSDSQNLQWYRPEDDLIQFKEALVFAFLGVLRWYNKTNILRSVTGSLHDHTGGIVINNSFK